MAVKPPLNMVLGVQIRAISVSVAIALLVASTLPQVTVLAFGSAMGFFEGSEIWLLLYLPLMFLAFLYQFPILLTTTLFGVVLETTGNCLLTGTFWGFIAYLKLWNKPAPGLSSQS